MGFTIDQNTPIDRGFQLSNNFLLEHFTTGAFHSVLGKWIPQFSAKLNPDLPNGIFSSQIPLWQIVQNLQLGAEHIGEQMLSEVGGLFNLRAGFLNNLSGALSSNELLHSFGSAIDISLKGYEDNIYTVAKDVQSLLRKASSIDLVYGNTSWFHVNIDASKALSTAAKIELPVMRTLDLTDGTILQGIEAVRGFI